MTHISQIPPDDPRLTAYALGELEGEELAAVEAALREDPAARAAVAEIRATAVQLEAALGAEAASDTLPVAMPPLRSAAIVPGRDLRKLDGGPLAKVIKFPQLYYVVGGMAAAAFAVLVALYQSPVRMPDARKAENSRAIQVAVSPATNDAEEKSGSDRLRVDAESKLEAAAMQDKKRDEVAAGRMAAAAPRLNESLKAKVAEREQSFADAAPKELAANAPTDLMKEVAEKPAEVSSTDAVATMPAPSVGGMAKDPEVQTMSKFDVASEKDSGKLQSNAQSSSPAPLLRQQSQNQLKNSEYRAYIQSNTNAAQHNSPGPGTRIGMEVQRTPLSIEVKSQEFLADTKTASINGSLQYSGGAALANPVTTDRLTKSERLDGAMRGFQANKQPNTESYAYQHDNDFLAANENPLSTFSVDVDTASYANVRRFLTEGRLPPPDAVRIEELVNYFPYHYAPPAADKPNKDALLEPFSASMEVAEAPWAPTHRLVRIGLKGREVSTAARAAANLVFLLDVSGSMDEPNKLPLVKESMRLLLGKLRADDRVAIVVYAGASGLALPSTPVAKSAEILGALDALTPGGSTNGAMGIELAYDIAKANFVSGGVNRVILCTDGDFNVGVTSEGDLTRLIEEKAKSGVFLTVLGFGMGNYKDATLEKLADKGNGNYGYIDSRREAEKLLVEQVSGTLVTIAKDVKLQVEFNPAQVASYRLIGYENRLLKKEDFNNDAVDAGEINAGHTVTALYEVVLASQVMGEGSGAMGTVDELKYQAGGRVAMPSGQNRNSTELLTLKVRYKEPAGTVSRKLEFPLTDGGARFGDASTDFKFAAAVAEFGMILRDSPHKGSATLTDVLAWAQAGSDNDAGGYRAEFVKLVQQAQVLMR